jgi:hypothetical protein
MADEYLAGVCNIGPAETARRRRIGRWGIAVTTTLLVVLGTTRAARPWRLLVALPAAMSAAGYLQAKRHFCANFGWRGLFNFGELGSVERVEDGEARASDRRQALRIGVESLGVGGAAALLCLVPKTAHRR